MKILSILALVFAFTLSAVSGDAEAAKKRLGSGKSSGFQRESTSLRQATPAPQQSPALSSAAAAKQPAAANAPQAGKRSWMGPIAGLAAGLGLAALASHFGFGDELASMLMMGLIAAAVMAAIAFFMRKKSGAASPASTMQYAGAGLNQPNDQASQYTNAYAGGGVAPTPNAGASNIPADFDVEGFIRVAKVNFLRLQAANDAKNLDDIRDFTSPEMFAEIKLSMGEREAEVQEVDIVTLDAQLLDVTEEANRFIASVRFNGLIREDKSSAAEPFDEIWHLTKPTSGDKGWVVAGIQQTE